MKLTVLACKNSTVTVSSNNEELVIQSVAPGLLLDAKDSSNKLRKQKLNLSEQGLLTVC